MYSAGSRKPLLVKSAQVRCGGSFANPPAKRNHARAISLNQYRKKKMKITHSHLFLRPKSSCHINKSPIYLARLSLKMFIQDPSKKDITTKGILGRVYRICLCNTVWVCVALPVVWIPGKAGWRVGQLSSLSLT